MFDNKMKLLDFVLFILIVMDGAAGNSCINAGLICLPTGNSDGKVSTKDFLLYINKSI